MKNYLCYSDIVIHSEMSYGTHVYFKHGYKDLEFSYFTEEEDIDKIINDLKFIVKKRINDLENQKD